MLRTAVQIGAIVCVSSVVQAGVVVELVPDNPGPYFGGESLTVDVWLQSQEPSDVELRTVFLDFSQTDPELTLDSAFEFDLSLLTSGAVYSVFPELPRPGVSYTPDLAPLEPGFYLPLPAIDPLHIGSVGLELPSTPGVFRVDSLNADQPDLATGGAVFVVIWGTDSIWLASDGEITGGVFDFAVIPEPSTLSLMVFGAVALVLRARRRSAKNRTAGRPPTGRSSKMPAPIAAFICTVGVCVSSVVQAGVVVELVPDNPGPYFGGESLTVDVWLNSDESSDFVLRGIQFDFSQTDLSISLDPTFTFDFSAVPDVDGYTTVPDLPVPWTYMGLDCLCPAAYFPFPGSTLLHIGTLGLELPVVPGIYRVDALNASEPDEALGARIYPYTPSLYPAGVWRAHTGEISGGTYDFAVIPEPATLSLLLLGSLGLLIPVRRRNWSGSFGTRVLVAVVALGSPAALMGQPAVVPAQKVIVSIDSGNVSAAGQGSAPVLLFSQVVSQPGAPWIRLHFVQVQLSGSPSAGSGSFLSITSLEDGAVQIVDSLALSAWDNTSACFNGNQVLLELFAYPGTGGNRVVVDQILVGLPGQPGGGEPEQQECYIDDRAPSDDPRAGRLFYFDDVFQSPATCTAFLFNDRSNCLLTAGHCCARIVYGEFAPLVEFNVPLSEPDGTINHPGPENQYPFDPDSDQFQDGGAGDDWCYFGVFDNSTTGSSPLEAQGNSYRLADEAPPADGSTLRITGYGAAVGELSATQQTATGAYVQLDGTTLRYDVYTVPGTSGSPVKHECRGLLYGIHTHGWCEFPNLINLGSTIQHAGLQTALANPLGVCADCNDNGIPDDQDIAGGTSTDCNGNGLPDDCEPDCNGNGVADRCDIDAGTSADVNDNLIPDDCEDTLFVDASATGANDGSSWADAYADLQAALDHSDPCGVDIAEIWVAEGVYTPAVCQSACDAASPERDESFQLPFGIILYGGFPTGGGDGTFQARSPVGYPTILSGDLNGDDGPAFANNDENSRAVVRSPSDSGLDGFHVVGGNANGTGVDAVGGGIWLTGDTTLFNCIVRGNSASNRGAGVLANWGNHTIVNCLFTGNEATNSGVGLYGSSTTSLAVRNCTFSGNSGSSSGAGIAYSGTAPDVRNCILWGNSVNGNTDESAQIYKVSGLDPPSIEYSCVQGWTGTLGGTGNIGSDPMFVDADGSDDLFGTADDDVRLSLGSPSIDAGKNYSGVPETTDLDGNPRRVDDPLTDDTGPGTAPIADMGAHEYYSDCNGNDIHDPFDPMDWDAEGDVDLADFAGFQVCFGDTTVECLAAFDRASECDVIDGADHAVFVWQLAGPGGQTARSATGGSAGDQEPLDGSNGALGIASPDDETAQGEAEPASGPVDTPIGEGPDCSRWEERALTLDVQPVGGGRPVRALAPNTTYELHYKAESVGVLHYVLWAVGTSPDVSLTAVTPASSGPWADTGNFLAYDLIDADEDPIPASHYPDGYYYYDLAFDQGLGRSKGQMCTFTTGQAGELGLHVYMGWAGGSPCVQLIMVAQVSFPVE